MEVLGIKTKEANLSNLVRIKVIPVSHVNRVRRLKSSNEYVLPSRPVRVKAGRIFYKFVTLPPFSNFNEPKKDTQAGVVYDQVVTVVLPGDSADVRYLLENLHEEKWIVAFQDSAGAKRLIGSKENPAIMSEDFSTAQPRGRKFEFRCTSAERAYFLESLEEGELESSLKDIP